jgi:magnesium transporter
VTAPRTTVGGAGPPAPDQQELRETDHEERLEHVRSLLQRGDDAALIAALQDLHPSDVADVVEELTDEQRLHVLEVVPADLGSDTLAEMHPEGRPEDLLVALEPGRIAELLGELPDDDAADLLGELDPQERTRLLGLLPRREAAELSRLLEHDEDSAGGIMTTELVAVSVHATAAEALVEVRRQARGLEDDFFTVFVVDLLQRLVGTARLQDLVIADPDSPIEEILDEPRVTVPPEMDQEEVARIIARYNLPAVPVVDPAGALLGRITFDDVIDVIEAEQTEDILRLAGASEDEEVRGGWPEAVRSRLPWLTLNILTIGLSSVAIWLFDSVVVAFTVLVALMPIVMALGGNAGTQALAVTIRRIALGEETASRRWRVAGKELMVGLVNGLVLGTITAAIVWLWQGSPALAAVILGSCPSCSSDWASIPRSRRPSSSPRSPTCAASCCCSVWARCCSCERRAAGRAGDRRAPRPSAHTAQGEPDRAGVDDHEAAHALRVRLSARQAALAPLRHPGSAQPRRPRAPCYASDERHRAPAPTSCPSRIYRSSAICRTASPRSAPTPSRPWWRASWASR